MESDDKEINPLIEHVKAHYQKQKFLTGKFALKLDIDHCYTELALINKKEQEEKEKKQLGEKKEKKQLGEKQEKKQLGEKQEKSDGIENRRLPSYEALHGTKNKIELDHIFNTLETHRVAVLGRAGIGKSTLCHRMAYQWAHGKLWQDQFDLVVWVPLRNIAHYSKKENNIAHIIQKECTSPNERNGAYQFKVSKIEKLTSTLKILYLLDGIDEVSALITTDSPQAKLIRKLFQLENVLVTSRPHSLDSFIGSLPAFRFDKILENMGFSDKHIDEFIEHFFSEASEKALSLKQHIKNNTNIRGIAHIPVILLLTCKFWENRPGSNNTLPSNMTELYQGIVDDLCEAYTKDAHRHPLLRCLESLAFKKMQESDLIISSKKIKKTIEKTAPSLLFEELLSLGLLTSTHEKSETKPHASEKDYYFVHLTFQEFFTARYLVRKLKERDYNIYLFIRDHKYNPRYEIIWWFVAGLLTPETPDETNEFLEIFFDIVESKPRDLAQIYHQLLVMRCMDECHLKTKNQRKEGFLERLQKFLMFDPKLSGDHTWRSYYLSLSGSVRSQPHLTDAVQKHLTPFLVREHTAAHLVCLFLSHNLLEDKSLLHEAVVNPTNLPPSVIGLITTLLPKNAHTHIELLDCLEMQQTSLPQETISVLTQLFEEETEEKYAVTILKILFQQKNMSTESMNKVLKLYDKPTMKMEYQAERRIEFYLSVFSTCIGYQETRLHTKVMRKVIELLKVRREISSIGSECCRVLGQQPSLTKKSVDRIMRIIDDPEWLDPSGNESRPRCKFDLYDLFAQKNLQELIMANFSRRWETLSVAGKLVFMASLRNQLVVSDEMFSNLLDAAQDENLDVAFVAIDTLCTQKNLTHPQATLMLNLFSDNENSRGVTWVSLLRNHKLCQTLITELERLLLDKDHEKVKYAAKILKKQKTLPLTTTEKIAYLACGLDEIESMRFYLLRVLLKQQKMSVTTYCTLSKALSFFNTNETTYVEVTLDILSRANELPLETTKKILKRVKSLLPHKNEKINALIFTFLILHDKTSNLVLAEESIDSTLWPVGIYAFRKLKRFTHLSESLIERVATSLRDKDKQKNALKIILAQPYLKQEFSPLITDLFENYSWPLRTVINSTTKLLIDSLTGITVKKRNWSSSHTKLLTQALELSGERLLFRNSDILFDFKFRISISQIIEAMSLIDKSDFSVNIIRVLAFKLFFSNIPIHRQTPNVFLVGNDKRLEFTDADQANKFEKTFQTVCAEYTGLDFDHKEEHFFDDVDHLMIRSMDMQKPPAFFEEQERLCQNPQWLKPLKEKVIAISDKRKIKVFVHYAWQFEPDLARLLNINELWSDCFVIKLAHHLLNLGFDVLFDRFESKYGDDMQDNMQHRFVNSADHILAIGTETYYHKYKKGFSKSVQVEVSYINARMESPHFVESHPNFFIPIICTDKPPVGMPFFDLPGAGKVSAHLQKDGYKEVLTKLVQDICSIHLQPASPKYSQAASAAKFGLHQQAHHQPTLPTSNIKGNSNNGP